MRVAVLMGGTSPEREISIRTGAGVSRALANLGHEVLTLDTGTGKLLREADLKAALASPAGYAALAPTVLPANSTNVGIEPFIRGMPRDMDLVFVALHGGDGENGTLQALLDLSRVPYTGSGVFASALAMDKAISKRVFVHEGIPTPEWVERWAPEDLAQPWTPDLDDEEIDRLGGFPLIVKPNDQGSTVGITVVHARPELTAALLLARQYGRLVLVERFIPGREVTVSVLNGKALPIVEIIAEGGFYDYEHKYTAGACRYEVPAKVPPETTERILSLGLRACRALRTSGVARVDFRLLEDGTPYCLEVNTVPGMTETSLVPKAAAAAGMSYEELVRTIVDSAPVRAAR
ncbi:MAG TPA: D-alanine--D-alanine ligase [Candidatus Limnocylindrales bacterium]|nr:D-alanine--D-alanine ligase [Candidatus Limnocylindrales bacterium]